MNNIISKWSELPKTSVCDKNDENLPKNHIGVFCGTCKEKMVFKNWDTFNQRDKWVEKSVSKQPITEIRASYNKKYNIKESDYWICYQKQCDLSTDDDESEEKRTTTLHRGLVDSEEID